MPRATASPPPAGRTEEPDPMVPSDLATRVEERINKGLLGLWYVVAKSVEVRPGTPHAVKALGRDLVLWRNADGRLSCLEDYCPHRGAPLSRGEVLADGHLACRYHGVTVDGTGTIVRVPAMVDCPLEGRRAVESFAAQEAADGIFVYFPSAERPEPPPRDLPYELTGSDYTSFLCTSPWGCNYRYALDNLADPMHGCYLHADTFTLAFGTRQDTMQVTDTKDGFIISRVDQQTENFDRSELVTETNCAPYCHIDIPYPKAAGPGGPMRVVTFLTPIDERHSQIFFWRCRRVSGIEAEIWRFMFRAIFEPRHWHVLEQDREMLEDMPDDARRRELLYQHDIGVTRIRRILAAKARAQVEAEGAATLRPAG
jgi:phenylpropionate dioxygenase-like ring-hydroxylating dioxygenase large terminal subunit